MVKKIYSAFIAFIAFSSLTFSQNGELKGTFVDSLGEPVPFAPWNLLQQGNPAAKGIANIDGYFSIKPLQAGKYELKFSSVGFKTLIISDITVFADKQKNLGEIKVKPSFTVIAPIEIYADTESILKTEPIEHILDQGEIKKHPGPDITAIAISKNSDIVKKDRDENFSSSGQRLDANKTIIDGIPGIGTMGISKQGIEEISITTKGTPANIGDAMGAVISITTRSGLRNKYFGGMEMASSQHLDAFGYNYGGFNFGGPIWCRLNEDSIKVAKAAFFLSGEISSDKDPAPSPSGVYKVKDDKLKFLQEHPLSSSDAGGGVLLNAELLHKGDLEKVKARQNVNKNTARLSGKIDWRAGKKTTFTLGGSTDYGRYHNFVYEYVLLNPENNPQYIYNTSRIYAKMQQRFDSLMVSNKKLRNVYYTLQAGYSKYGQTIQDDSHKDKIFNYGYIGKFNTFKAPVFTAVKDDSGNVISYKQTGIADTLVQFSAGDENPLSSVYTSQYYDIFGNPNTLSDIQQGYGLLNGDRPRSVYSIWYNTGRQSNGYSNTNQEQLRFAGSFSADINKHNIQAGFEWERRNEKFWSAAPVGLWTLMRQLSNRHITQLDMGTDVLYLTLDGIPYYTHPFIVNGQEQSQFDKSFREENNIPDNVWVDIDSYNPDKFSLGMFSPDELLNGGNPYVSYYGYSYDGKKMSKSDFNLAALENYYKQKDENGNYMRETPSFRPLYAAGYIQDKFEIKDMRFNIGVRVDHFDAKQPVLKDKYLMNEAFTAGEDKIFSHPSNIPSDAVVYVDDMKNPSAVLGYRYNDTWYNAQGAEVADPKIITPSSGVIQPYLKYPGEKFLEQSKVSNVFENYKAQNTFMPRIAFNFPITTEANFFAHYDVLTQRPPSFLRFNPSDYLFIQAQGGVLNNSALKPERTTDYEVGFSQKLDKDGNAAVTLSAFYRELRDMIQTINVYGAYPVKYTTFGNVDFGTVKGFTASYETRRIKSVKMSASYTLQFAEGTGSAANSAAGIISAGQPNLRTTMPLDFDQRHSIVLNADYRFGNGKDYRGPDGKWIRKLFENLGSNVVMRAGSGLPYTRQKNVTSGNGDNSSAVVFGINQRASMKGKINGSNLPWQYRMDFRIDKDILLVWKKETKDEKAKESALNVYVDILNALNTKNILNVYRYTGDPDDDGYLSAPDNQNGINNYLDPQSFRDLYESKIANPSHYSIPRRIRVGLTLDF